MDNWVGKGGWAGGSSRVSEWVYGYMRVRMGDWASVGGWVGVGSYHRLQVGFGGVGGWVGDLTESGWAR